MKLSLSVSSSLRMVLPVLFCALAASALPRPASAAEGFSCVVMGKRGQSVRTPDGGAHEAPVRLASCEGAVVQSDGVNVCYVNEKRERRCRALAKGTTITRTLLGASDTGGLTDTVVAMARGDTRTVAGQTRNTTRIEGLPFGQVAAPGAALGYDLTLDARTKQVKALRITEDADAGATLLQLDAPPAQGTLDLAAAKPDTWYRWNAELEGGRRLSGRFLLLGPTADAARAELARLDADRSLADTARWYLKAEACGEAGLVHERLLAAQVLKRLLSAN